MNTSPKNACGAESRVTRSGRCMIPTFASMPERLGAGSRVRREERADDPEQRDSDHRSAGPRRDQVMEMVSREEDREPTEHSAVGDAVERRVVERAEHRGSPGTTRDRAVEHVE